MTKYTVGFAFNHQLDEVLLMRKLKPAWQFKMLNGIGGHIEAGETPLECQHREYHEEVESRAFEWQEFGVLKCIDFEVYLFASRGTIKLCRPKTDEKLEIVPITEISHRIDMIENLPWLIHAAIDFLVDGRPRYFTVDYPNKP